MSRPGIRVRMTFELIPGERGLPPVPVQVTLAYEPTDPYAIRASFATRAGSTEWHFSRELLGTGLIEHAGGADITIAPLPARQGHVELTLSSPSGLAVFAAPTAPLQEFLAHTYAAVPAGTEMQQVDLDGWLEAVLEGQVDRWLASAFEEFPTDGGTAR